MSNQEVLKGTKEERRIKECNYAFHKKEWQRNTNRDMVAQLTQGVDDEREEPEREFDLIMLPIRDDKLVLEAEVPEQDSESETPPSSSSDANMLPDVYKYEEVQPDDNDSSDYGADVEESELIDD